MMEGNGFNRPINTCIVHMGAETSTSNERLAMDDDVKEVLEIRDELDGEYISEYKRVVLSTLKSELDDDDERWLIPFI
jgi:hypothetical protein